MEFGGMKSDAESLWIVGEWMGMAPQALCGWLLPLRPVAAPGSGWTPGRRRPLCTEEGVARLLDSGVGAIGAGWALAHCCWERQSGTIGEACGRMWRPVERRRGGAMWGTGQQYYSK